MLHPQETLNCKGRLLWLNEPKVMGILNVTPDSFFAGSRVSNGDELLKRVEKMLEDGASILDVGGMSSRPGAEIISVEEEMQRVLPSIELISTRFPEAIISIDTVYAEVAKAAIDRGASMVNDISAGRIDDQMYTTVAACEVPYVLMHMQGKPRDMQHKPQYEDVISEVLDFFIAEVGKLRGLGLKDIIIDPGFGFGKKMEHNYQLLKSMHVFKILDLPIMTGLSRKSMVHKIIGKGPENALNGTSALHMVALMQGSILLRTHDVAQAIEVIKLWQQMEKV